MNCNMCTTYFSHPEDGDMAFDYQTDSWRCGHCTEDHSFDDEYLSPDAMTVTFSPTEQDRMDVMYDRVYRAWRTASAFLPEDFSPEEAYMLLSLKII